MSNAAASVKQSTQIDARRNERSGALDVASATKSANSDETARRLTRLRTRVAFVVVDALLALLVLVLVLAV